MMTTKAGWLRHRKKHITCIAAVPAVLLAVGLLLSGCAEFLVGAGIGAAGVAYVEGNLHAHLKANPPAVERASLKAFKTLDIRKTSSVSSAVDARIIGRTANNTEVSIVVKAEGKGESKLTLRVGILGDQATSRRIYDEIRKHL